MVIALLKILSFIAVVDVFQALKMNFISILKFAHTTN
jgi:hypothetical protein